MLKALLSLSAVLLTFTAASQAEVVNGLYNGTARTTVKYLHPQTMQVVKIESYGRKLQVVIAPRKESGGVVETNPFFWRMVPTTRTTPPSLGDVAAASSRVVSSGGGSVLLQYWNLRNTVSGFDGALVNNHTAEGLAKDRIVAKLGDQRAGYLMHDASVGAGLQCKVVGTATGKQLKVTVDGYAFVPGRAVVQFSTSFTGQRP
jgi:hypothetical protein